MLANRLQNYAAAIKRTDSTAIAGFYAADGWMADRDSVHITGPAAIAAELARYAAYHVLDESMIGEATLPEGKDWRISGHYAQTVRIPNGETVNAKGSFTSLWRCNRRAGWLLQELHTS